MYNKISVYILFHDLKILVPVSNGNLKSHVEVHLRKDNKTKFKQWVQQTQSSFKKAMP